MHKVLIFEGDAAFAGVLSNELGKLGCEVSIVNDGYAGLKLAATEKPDLILLAIELPGMNGFSVCNKLKKDPTLRDVPLIIMSSESSLETFEQHRKLRARAEDYVRKPIRFSELFRRIQAFIRLGQPSSPGGQADGLPGIGAKLREEAGQFAIAIEKEGNARVIAEAADVVHQVMMALHRRGIEWGEVLAELDARAGAAGKVSRG